MDGETVGLVVALFLTAVVGWKVARECMPESADGFLDVLGAVLATAGALVALTAAALLAIITFAAV